MRTKKRIVDLMVRATMRLWKKTRVPFDEGPECWEFTGQRDKDGYGRLYATLPHGAEKRAHRIAWSLHNGPIPAGMQINHTCDNPPCVRPSASHPWDAGR